MMVNVLSGRTGLVDRLLVRLFKPSLGAWGEWIALCYLRRQGWDIVARNWEGSRGELDLVGYDNEFLVFVEVKTRQWPSPLPPEDQMTRKKELTLDSLISEFTMRYEVFDCPTRLDLIAIETEDMVGYQLRHYVAWDEQ